ncbi:hypothetical protein [Flavobacterium xinjiangense]|uniref:Uncharacterized protein n=1 Tax=Flavobacterium xinjiangense TaxID=178356 RepID=A0A1M7PUH3_9FLAO|nr:hypothetical protein [Flavobacterium xinjiangense]SHN21190.1 hypothetical protein SAMN05216269_12324 [Flavobacterium xinjiangense]
MKKRNSLILLSSGMFVIAISQILSHFVELPDLAKGLFIGIGIGMLLLAIIFGNRKTAQ